MPVYRCQDVDVRVPVTRLPVVPLRLVGAGLPRTGTSSLRDALTVLLDAPIYHMSEVLAHPEHGRTWVEAIDGRPIDWERFLTGYAAGVDAPFSTCWRELAAAYPEAPVLLSRREDPQVWYRSMVSTVIPRTLEMTARGTRDPLAPLFEVIFRGDFTDIDDREQVIAGYERRLAEVREEIEPERLVEWTPADGWKPICDALGLPVPNRPFPHRNSTQSYRARQHARARQDEARARSVQQGHDEHPPGPTRSEP